MRTWFAQTVTSTSPLLTLFFGVIGEYLGRVYRQVKRGPLTIVEHELNGGRLAVPRPTLTVSGDGSNANRAA